MAGRCLILVGMPGAGKSTLGKAVAERLGLAFIDTDDVLLARLGTSLADFMAVHGVAAFREAEEAVVLDLEPQEPTVIATGGSVVFAAQAMAHLQALGPIVYIKVDADELRRRVPDFVARGVVGAGEGTLDVILAERAPLYEQYATHVVDGGDIPVTVDTLVRITERG